jgi:hypothetical protein
MNLTQLKNYAPAARRAFIEAVTRRAGVLGIRKDRVEEVSESGDIALIGGLPFPRSVVPLRRHLLDRIAAEGFDAAMEAMAYTWFTAAVQQLGAGHASVFINLVPVFAVLQAAILLDERLGLPVLFGGLLVIAGVWLTTLKKTTLEKTA